MTAQMVNFQTLVPMVLLRERLAELEQADGGTCTISMSYDAKGLRALLDGLPALWAEQARARQAHDQAMHKAFHEAYSKSAGEAVAQWLKANPQPPAQPQAITLNLQVPEESVAE